MVHILQTSFDALKWWCQVLQEFLSQTKESDILKYKISDLQLVDLKYMMEEFKSCNEGSQQCWRYFLGLVKISLYAGSTCSFIFEKKRSNSS